MVGSVSLCVYVVCVFTYVCVFKDSVLCDFLAENSGVRAENVL